MANIYHIFLAICTLQMLSVLGQISRKVECEEAPLDVVILIDINANASLDFAEQLSKIIEIIKHIESISTERDVLYSVVAFHKRPVILSSIVSPGAAKPTKIVERIKSLEPRNKYDSSPAKALELAAQQFINNGRITAHKIVVLAHDGFSTDLIPETLEARNSLESVQAQVFAISSASNPNLPALTGYTMNRARVYTNPSDREVFFEELERASGACTHLTKLPVAPLKVAAFGVPVSKMDELKDEPKSQFEGDCTANKIDLAIAFDTSGSVYNGFTEERQLAHNFIDAFPSEAFDDGRMQVSIVKFSSHAKIALPFELKRPKSDVLKVIDDIEFTGSDTRIARAIELLLTELERARREDAIQIFLLISDGYGQEFWHVVQTTGKKLQNVSAEIYAVSTSTDYNLPELAIYTGDPNRVFVGPQHAAFLPTVTPLIINCLQSDPSKAVDSSLIQIGDDSEKDSAKRNIGGTGKSAPNLLGKDSGARTTEVSATQNNPVLQTIQSSAEPGSISGTTYPVTSDTHVTGDFPDISNVGGTKPAEDLHEITDTAQVISAPRSEQFVEAVTDEKSAVPSQFANINVQPLSDTNHRGLQNLPTSPTDSLPLHEVPSTSSPPNSASTRENVIDQGFDKKISITPLFHGTTGFEHTLKEPSTLKHENQFALRNLADSTRSTLPARKLPATEVIPANFPGNEASFDDSEEVSSALNDLKNNRKGVVRHRVKGSLSRGNGLKINLDEKQQNKLEFNKNTEDNENRTNLIHSDKKSLITDDNGGQVDLLLLIDRSPGLAADLTKQLQLAIDLIEQADDTVIADSTVRIAVISFAADARIDLGFGNITSKDEIIKVISRIEHTPGETSTVAGINLATEYAERSRRPDARLAVVLISDGNSQDLWHTLTQAVKELHKLPNTVTYAVSTGSEYTFVELEAFAGDKWRVFVDERSKIFPQKAGEIIFSEDDNPSSEFKTPAEGKSPQNRIMNFVVILDKSTTAGSEFEDAKTLISKLLKSVPSTDYKSRIRCSLIILGDKIDVRIELNKSASREEIIRSIQRIYKKPSENSVPDAVSAALNQIESIQKGTGRTAIVLVSDGGSEDSESKINATAEKLQELGVEVYAIPITQNFSYNQLFKYTGNDKRIFPVSADRVEKVISAINLNDRGPAKDPTKLAENDNTVEKVAVHQSAGSTPNSAQNRAIFKMESDLGDIAESRSDSPSTLQKTQIIAEDTTVLTKSEFEFSSQAPSEKPVHSVPLNPDCKVDLMFIIDRSQSVEKEFQKQKQFATDLIKRIPSSSFLSRVRVASVSFNIIAEIDFRFDEYDNQTQILDALSSIEHTGGSTSAVSGVNLAVKEIKNLGRKDARKMVVLISDGNSQDAWEELLVASDRLRAVEANVYAVTASHDYYFRELELYAGNKWLVYIDARKRQFLDDAELSIMQCQSPSAPISSLPPRDEFAALVHEGFSRTVGLPTEIDSEDLVADVKLSQNCKDDLIDVVLIIDTSTSVEDEFYAEKEFALKLIKAFPEKDFSKRIAVAAIHFAGVAKTQFRFGKEKTRSDVLYELERIEHTGGQTSLVSGTQLALNEIDMRGRQNARLLIVIISDGNSQDIWQLLTATAKKLRKTGGEVYAVTLSSDYNLEELAEYTGNVDHIYTESRIDTFIKDVIASVQNCSNVDGAQTVTDEFVERFDTTTISESTSLVSKTSTRADSDKSDLISPNIDTTKEKSASRLAGSNSLVRDEEPVIPVIRATSDNSKNCKYSKMDLEIILDASTSRQQVFEHQRELALSLIERLPIEAGETHVAVGINSFTQVPTLRQTLGLGRDKQMVRHAIEDIKYNGGSTFTAQAVELSVQDLQQGRRPDAIQVVVLMNDGISQDPWDKVLQASNLLRSTGAELFGVALGDRIDLRELRHYIGDENRIYRDNSTERFLTDVVSVLTGGPHCRLPTSRDLGKTDEYPQLGDVCKNHNLDVVFVFDNADQTENLSDPSISSNRYLLLDILGSLPVTEDDDGLKMSVITFTEEPQLVIGLDDQQSKQTIFSKVEAIEAQPGKPAYAKAVDFALQEYDKSHRGSARGILVLIGDGHTNESSADRNTSARHIHDIPGLTCYAVDSSKSVNNMVLSKYTGSSENVFNYDRNADFAKVLLNAATAAEKANCDQKPAEGKDSLEVIKDDLRIQNIKRGSRSKDIVSQPETNVKEFVAEKVIVKEKTTRRTKHTTRRPKTTKNPEVNSTRNTEAEAGYNVTSALRPSNKKLFTAVSKIKTTTASTTRKPTTPTRPSIARTTVVTESTMTESSTPFTPGCEIDAIVLIDSSGSVEDTFTREKELASGILKRLRIGPKNARVAIIKFAANVETVYSFDQPQTQQKVLQALESIAFRSGTTAIHSALLRAITEYSSAKGARPGEATPFGIIFTDGFGQKDPSEAASLLRKLVPNMFAVAINHEYPIARPELLKIAGSTERVFTNQNIDKLYSKLENITKSC